MEELLPEAIAGGLVAAVLPRVEQVQVRQVAELEIAVDAHLILVATVAVQQQAQEVDLQSGVVGHRGGGKGQGGGGDRGRLQCRKGGVQEAASELLELLSGMPASRRTAEGFGEAPTA